jgi:hypothetical protein
VSGPLSGVPVGTTSSAQLAKPSLPAGAYPVKTAIFILDFDDTTGLPGVVAVILPQPTYGRTQCRKFDGHPVNS